MWLTITIYIAVILNFAFSGYFQSPRIRIALVKHSMRNTTNTCNGNSIYSACLAVCFPPGNHISASVLHTAVGYHTSWRYLVRPGRDSITNVITPPYAPLTLVICSLIAAYILLERDG